MTANLDITALAGAVISQLDFSHFPIGSTVTVFEGHWIFVWMALSVVLLIPVYDFVVYFVISYGSPQPSCAPCDNALFEDVLLFEAMRSNTIAAKCYYRSFRTFDSAYLALRIARRIEPILKQNASVDTFFEILDEMAKNRKMMRENGFKNKKIVALEGFCFKAKQLLSEGLIGQADCRFLQLEREKYRNVCDTFRKCGRKSTVAAFRFVMGYVIAYEFATTSHSCEENNCDEVVILDKPCWCNSYTDESSLCYSPTNHGESSVQWQWPIDLLRPQLVITALNAREESHVTPPSQNLRGGGGGGGVPSACVSWSEITPQDAINGPPNIGIAFAEDASPSEVVSAVIRVLEAYGIVQTSTTSCEVQTKRSRGTGGRLSVSLYNYIARPKEV